MVGIYKITNPKGKVYIGQSWNIQKRWKEYTGLHVKQQPKILSSLQKYGANQHIFEIACELPADVSQSVLDQYEMLYWAQYRDSGCDMMNLREPSSHGRHSEDSRKLISQRRLGMKFSPEHVANMSQSRIGKTQSRATIDKRIETRKQNGTYGYVSESTLTKATEAKIKPVIHLETGITYLSVNAAAALGCGSNAVRRRIQKGILKYI